MNEQQIKELRETGVYDYITNHYFEMSQYEIKELACEMIWQLEQSKGDYWKANAEVAKVMEEDNE